LFRARLAQNKASASGSTELAEVSVEPFCYSASRLGSSTEVAGVIDEESSEGAFLIVEDIEAAVS